MSFEEKLSARSACVYADFLEPHLREDSVLLDCGTGSGTIAVGLSSLVSGGRVVALDLDVESPREAMAHAVRSGISNLRFLTGDARQLPFDDDCFDAVFSHSMLETLEEPLLAVSEMRRVLQPGGTVAVASVEYSGVICGGPHRALLERFYAVKERVWELEGLADPRMGRNLRKLLAAAGFESVRATAKSICYGTESEVRAFGRGRADDSRASWFLPAALRHKLLTRPQLEEIRAAWLDWAESPDAFAAFSWCRAVARKPESGARA